MAITTRLIGTLGGEPEVVSQQIAVITSGSHSVTLPTGWGSAWCIFQGNNGTWGRATVNVFGRETYLSDKKSPIGGGLLLTTGQSTTIGRYLSGTLTMIRMT